MGDRVSIQFEKDGERSVTLFSHWDGRDIVKAARDYVAELSLERGESSMMPIDRREPGTVMVDFIRWYLYREKVAGVRVESNYYLGATEADGDNSDNGNHIISLGKKTKAKTGR